MTVIEYSGISPDVRREREVSRIASQLFSNSSADRSVLSDPALHAFAQLAACRLDATRCLISLFDRNHQFVVAESTKTSNLRPVTCQDDDIWLGGTAFLRSQGPCEHVLRAADDLPRIPDGTAPDAPLEVSIVPDLASDGRYCKRPGICDGPLNRFYAGIALRSSNGINIGVICVFDPEPRAAGLDQSQIECLRNLSHIITTYLEFGESFTAFQRSERKIRGLEAFVKGHDPVAPGAATPNPRNTESHRPQPLPVTHENNAAMTSEESLLAKNLSTDSETAVSPTATPKNDSTIAVLDSRHRKSSIDSDQAIGKLNLTGISQPADLNKIMARAANLIRESLDVTGVTFLDASAKGYGGLVEGGVHSPHSPHSRQGSETQGTRKLSRGQHSEVAFSSTLGCAISPKASHNNDASCGTCSALCRVPESLLKKLLKLYPNGKVFDLTHGTDLIDHGKDAQPIGIQGPQPVSSVSNWHASETNGDIYAVAIAALFPKASSIAFVPLWDQSRGRWFAASFTWTESPGRSFTAQGEIDYLRAFATSIMAEIDRADSASKDLARSTLLGSLSHELRSPLHGIVAAVELLHDTELNALQGDLLSTMNACGRTLLDVIDHLLDYSKINKLNRNASISDSSVNQPSNDGTQRHESLSTLLNAVTTTVELDALMEETVESMFTTQVRKRNVPPGEKQKSGSTVIKTRGVTQEPDESFMPHALDAAHKSACHSNVSVYLDIEPDLPWSCQIASGAIRRIVMNLLGNALKYTDQGYISVSMRQEKHPGESGILQPWIVLNVTDSGKGMSRDFLHNYAFEPFRQENPLSQGTGIGLSLVSQIVQSLEGSIRIDSQPDCGTSATVMIPIKTACVLETPESQFAQNAAALKGCRVSLYGFKNKADAGGLSTAKPPIDLELMQTLCRRWLNLEARPQNCQRTRPDLIVCTDTVMRDGLIKIDKRSPPVVVICHNAKIAHKLWTESRDDPANAAFEFISQPIGPRKLANAMVLALGRYNDARASDLTRVGLEVEQQERARKEFMVPVIPLSRVASSQSGLMAPLSRVSSSQPWLPVDYGSSEPSSPLDLQSIPDPALDEKLAARLMDTDIGPPLSRVQSIKLKQERNQILLVDDNRINLQILVTFMKKLKYPYQTATNGLEALQAYSANPCSFSHILMDISMPVMDGLESTRNIRTVEGTLQLDDVQDLPPVKIIALTGLVSADAQQEAFASGVDMYLTKPVRLKELTGVLQKAKMEAIAV